MDKKTELKAKIFDLIAITEIKMEELNNLHKERQSLLVQLDELEKEPVMTALD